MNNNTFNIKEIKKSIGLILFIGFCSLMLFVPKQVVFAGEINSNEAGLIAAASGTFSYDNKTYKAGSAYINSLTAYLSSDDVDLTADQCERAKSQMYANVAEGISRGYLYEVKDNDKSDVDNDGDEDLDDESDDKEKSNKEKNNDGKSDGETSGTNIDDKNLTGDSGESTDNIIDNDSDNNDAMNVWDSMSNQSEAKTKLKQRPEENDASASVKLEDDSIVVTTKDNEKINLKKSEQLISNKILYIIDVVSIIVFIITLLCGLLLAGNKCLVFKKPKKRRARPGHTRRRKIRRYTRNVLTVTTAVSFIAIFLFIGIYISIFNKDTIMQNMQSSGYFRYAYSEYITEMAENYFNESEKLDSDSIVAYEDFLFTVKQNSLKILSGETDIRIPSSNVSPYIYNIKNSYMKVFVVAGVLFILSALLGIILMIFMDQSRERGTKHIAAAMLIASGIIVIITLYMALVKPYLHIYIEPDYLYLFIMECILWSVKVMSSISAFSVVFGMLLIGVYKTQINNKES